VHWQCVRSSVAISTMVVELSAASIDGCNIAVHKCALFRHTFSELVNDFDPTCLMCEHADDESVGNARLHCAAVNAQCVRANVAP
jgi:hypothetical protein